MDEVNINWKVTYDRPFLYKFSLLAKPKIMSSENCLQHCGGVGGRCDWCGQPNAFCCSKSERLCNNAVREIALDYHVCIALETQGK